MVAVSTTHTDEFDEMVDYGGLRYHTFFDPKFPHITPLPTLPPPAACFGAGERCGCPHCDSQGRYALSPACRFWRAYCNVCNGARSWLGHSSPGRLRLPCEVCAIAWREDVAWFRYALRYPRAAARVLRDEAAARHRPRLVKPTNKTVPNRGVNARALFERAAATEDRAAREQRTLDRRDGVALVVGGGVEGLARTIQRLHDLAAAYREHGRRQLIAHDPTDLRDGTQ